MLKIECPECGQTFIWTDDMPLRGKCPKGDCDWQYDVRKELKRSVGRRTSESVGEVLRCPGCDRPLGRKWGFCRNCGVLVLGNRSIPKRHLVALLILVLMALSLLAKYLF